MARICKVCGSEIEEDALFCMECGAKADEPAVPAAEPVKPAAEIPIMPIEPAPAKPAEAPKAVPEKKPSAADAKKEEKKSKKEEKKALKEAKKTKKTKNSAPADQQGPGVAPIQRRPRGGAYGVVSTGGFMGLMFLYGIPVLGWLMCIILAFAPKNENIKNFSKAILTWVLIGIVLSLVLAIVIVILADTGVLSDILQNRVNVSLDLSVIEDFVNGR